MFPQARGPLHYFSESLISPNFQSNSDPGEVASQGRMIFHPFWQREHDALQAAFDAEGPAEQSSRRSIAWHPSPRARFQSRGRAPSSPRVAWLDSAAFVYCYRCVRCAGFFADHVPCRSSGWLDLSGYLLLRLFRLNSSSMYASSLFVSFWSACEV